MWQRLAKFVLKNRFVLLFLLAVSTAIMGYFASRVKLSYDFARAIPTDNPRYKDYQHFKQLFGDDGNMLVIGIQSKDFFRKENYEAYRKYCIDIRKVHCVEDVLCVPSAVMLRRDSINEKLLAEKIFHENYDSQFALDSAAAIFKNIPFYKGMLYNADSASYLMAVRINKDSLNSPARVAIIDGVMKVTDKYAAASGISTHLSGLPLIRTMIAERIRHEMGLFLWGSLILSAVILFLFFRSFSTTAISLTVVLIGVVWAVATIYLCGYKITLLTALIPSLVVVIGIPNCIYFINKYHTSYLHQIHEDEKQKKEHALVDMVSKMGVVTLFCNITAAIGFAVFALTKSAILKEFGVVSGISIMMIFVISFILLPSVLSYLPSPDKKQLRYLDNKWIVLFLDKVETWVFHHRKIILYTTAIVLVVSVVGILRLKSVAYIVDDLPKTDKIYTDLKFFERNFRGVMPLEIVVDSKKRRGLRGLTPFYKVDSLATYIATFPEMNRPLTLSEGLKFATMGFNDNDSTAYRLPGDFEAVFLNDYLNQKGTTARNGLSKMLSSFIDTSKRYTRLSVNMADVGTKRLPVLIDSIQSKADHIFDTTSYKVTLTGTSITFQEGSKFIINGLKESIFWAFLLIAVCMLYLFRSLRILICSLLPNLIPLVVTAGIMGWTGVPIKPSTVLVFSVALGIAVDITIRFLVNYRQVLPFHHHDVALSVRSTVRQTGLSIIYTSLVLTAGFIIFCGSGFGGTFSLGWLTSVTLIIATITNIIFLPVLLLILLPPFVKK